jgi:ACS family hexuronate transporter-like MFS transporter
MADVGETGRVRNWKVTTALILGWQIAASICFYAIYAAMPFIRDEFGLSATLIGVVVTVLMLGYTVFLVPSGAIIDTYGEARVLVVGLFGLAVSAVSVTVAPTYLALLVAVFVLGGFYATAIPGTNKAVFNAIPQDRLNTSMGIKQVGVTAGSGITAVAIPWFGATRFGWETGFLLIAIVAVVVSVLFWVAYGVGGLGSDTTRFRIRDHFENPEYALLTLAGFFLGAGLFTTIGYTILFVEESVGAGVVFAGLTLAAAQLFGSAGRVVSGWLADRLAASLTVSTLRILIVQTAGAFCLFLIIPLVEMPVIALVLFGLLGFFILGFTNIYYSCIGSMVPSSEMGSATAGGQIALNAGALLAPPTFGLLVDVRSYTAAWTMLAAASFAALLLLVVVRRRI